MPVLRQISRIIAGYLISALLTGFAVYLSLSFDPATATRHMGDGSPAFALLIAFMIAWFASFPATLTILLGEWLAWRQWWPNSISGSLIGLWLGWVFQPPDFFPWLGLVLGVGSGAIYWAIAGRKAGMSLSTDRNIVLVVVAVLSAISFLVSVPGLFGFPA